MNNKNKSKIIINFKQNCCLERKVSNLNRKLRDLHRRLASMEYNFQGFLCIRKRSNEAFRMEINS